METPRKKSEKEQIVEIIQFIFKNWYYFIIGFSICGIIGVIYLKTATPVWNTKAQVSLRSDESLVGGSISKASSLMSSFGFSSGSESIEDETLKLSSQGNMKKLVKKLGLNITYTESKFFGMCEKNLYDSSPIILAVDPFMADTLSTRIEFNMNIQKEKTTIKMKAGKNNAGTYEILSYPSTLETPWGEFTFNTTDHYQSFNQSSKLKIHLYNYDSMAQLYQRAIFIDFHKKTSDLINLAYQNENVPFAKGILNEVINTYNKEWIEDKHLVTNNTVKYIDTRIEETKELLLQADTQIQKFKEENNLTHISADIEYYFTLSGGLQTQLLEAETQLNIANILIKFVENEQNKYSLIPFDLTLADANMSSAINNYNNQLVRRNDILNNENKQSALIQSLNKGIDLQRENLIISLENIRKGLEISLSNIKKKENEFNSKLRGIPQIEKNYLSLRREQELQQTMHSFLLEMREQAAIKGVNILPKLKVIDAPYLSNSKVSPRKLNIFVFVLISGLLVSLSLIYGKTVFTSTKKLLKNI